MDDEHTPRPDDHLVEPMYDALHRPGGGPGGGPDAPSGPDRSAGRGAGPEGGPEAGRGCLGLLLLTLLSLAGAPRGVEPAPAPGEVAEEGGSPGLLGSAGLAPNETSAHDSGCRARSSTLRNGAPT